MNLSGCTRVVTCLRLFHATYTVPDDEYTCERYVVNISRASGSDELLNKGYIVEAYIGGSQSLAVNNSVECGLAVILGREALTPVGTSSLPTWDEGTMFDVRELDRVVTSLEQGKSV